jgi:hypothetical protein
VVVSVDVCGEVIFSAAPKLETVPKLEAVSLAALLLAVPVLVLAYRSGGVFLADGRGSAPLP